MRKHQTDTNWWTSEKIPGQHFFKRVQFKAQRKRKEKWSQVVGDHVGTTTCNTVAGLATRVGQGHGWKNWHILRNVSGLLTSTTPTLTPQFQYMYMLRRC